MPELPEVETVKIGLNQHTLGWKIIGGEVLLPGVVSPSPDFQDPAEFLHLLQGCCFHVWQRRGKYLLASLTQPSGTVGGYLAVHLRMTGKLSWSEPDQPVHPHTRIRFFCHFNSHFSLEQSPHKELKQELKKELRFNDQRTFGKVWYVPPTIPPEARITGLQKLGLEPFAPGFDYHYLAAKFGRSSRPIKNLLLDQATLAGLGNIYVDESLFLACIHPLAPSNSLSISQVQALHQAIQQSLADGISWGGTTFSDFADLGGEKGNYLDHAWVFRRQGQACHVCQTPIARIKLAGRSTHFCPNCQAH
ncbi:MAG: DNA-formamidopyrimidine glycosylase [Pseudanabaenaceae cyanobacterium bins.68]|nr:DNA-formamidopyrimidine glycosylase [Pseudanabaenaceae cyanobacterium bins.68]